MKNILTLLPNFYFLLFIFFIGCSKQKEKTLECDAAIEKKMLIKNSDKIIVFDSTTSIDKISTFFFQSKNIQEFYVINLLKSTIQIYDWNSGKMTSKIKLNKEGPDGVGNVGSIFVKSKDSLYLLSSYEYRLSLINSKGKLLETYVLFDKGASNEKFGVVTLGNHSNHMYMYNDYILMSGYPMIDRKSEKFYYNGSYGLKLNIKTKEISSLMDTPKNYSALFENGYMLTGQQMLPSQCFNPVSKKIIISFPTENELYEVDVKSREIVKHCCKSKLFDNFQYSKLKGMDDMQELKYYSKQPNYAELYFDSINNRYYRFVYSPNPLKMDLFSNDPWWKVSVIILDENFTVLGEEKLDKSFRNGEMIITNKGFYIREFTEKENAIKYTLYQLSSL